MHKSNRTGSAGAAAWGLTLSAGLLALASGVTQAQQIAPAQGGNDNRKTQIPNMNCSGDVAAPARVEVAIGKSTLLKLPEPTINRTLGNPNVAQAMLVAPDTLYLLGVSVGTTNMIVQGKSKRCNVVEVAVSMDASGLINTLRELMPEEKDIRVTAAAESLILSGTVTDAVAMQRAFELALAYVRRPAVMSAAAQQEGLANTAGGQASGPTSIQLQQQRIVNMMTLAAAQQVMLEVKIAEVSKSLIDKLGVRLNGSLSGGMWSYQLLSNFLTGTLGATVTGARSTTTGITLEAEKRDGLVKVLAEPNVMAISGQEGSFLAGGKIFIPVSQGGGAVGGVPTISLQEKDFGVGLRFTPTVLSGGRINLQVAPEVSELSREGAAVSASNNATQIFPLITTRRASTTVQLADGQSFAIGGLIKNNTTTNIRAFPILGEIPILGALFRSTDFQNDKTELVFVVTPRLVKPLPPDYPLPTDGYRDPTRSELFLGGKLEGKAEPQRSSPQGKGAAGFEMK